MIKKRTHGAKCGFCDVRIVGPIGGNFAEREAAREALRCHLEQC